MLIPEGLFSNRKVYYHISGWIVFFLLHYFIFSAYEVKIDLGYQLLFWTSNIILFYVNYLVLIPYLLFSKKIGIYLITFILLFSFFYFAQTKFMDYQFAKRIQNMAIVFNNPPGPVPSVRNQNGMPFSSDRPGPPKHRANGMALYNVLLFLAASTSIRVLGRFELDEKRKKDAENHKTREELKLLKQQINPHFLFNSLNNIYSLAIKKSGQTAEAVLKLSGTLRYMLYDVNKSYVLLKNEIGHIHNFIELQKFRLTNVTEISITMSGDPDEYLIEPLLLLPFVENAYKFGVDNHNNSFISIMMKVESGNFNFEVKNRIVNKNKSAINENSGGIGLSNVKRRLEILYQDQHKLVLKEEKDIYTVQLELKLKK